MENDLVVEWDINAQGNVSTIVDINVDGNVTAEGNITAGGNIDVDGGISSGGDINVVRRGRCFSRREPIHHHTADGNPTH